jgi:hypothetical protein
MSYPHLTDLWVNSALAATIGAGTLAHASPVFNSLSVNSLNANSLTAGSSALADLNGVTVEAVTLPVADEGRGSDNPGGGRIRRLCAEW